MSVANTPRTEGSQGVALVMRAIANTFQGIATAIRARPKVFWGVAAGVCVFNLVAPVVILSIARKPPDFFTFNPWLSRLPDYVASDEVPLSNKLAFLSNMAIAWASADNLVEGLEWGFVIDVPSIGRILFTSLLFATYFALWSCRRSQVRACGLGVRAARPAGVAGAVTTVLGLTTGPCSVAGCGVPVLPVVGLAFTGISSGTLALFTTLARVGITVVLFVMIVAVLWLGWRVATTPATGQRLA
jgi:hypothetical protein